MSRVALALAALSLVAPALTAADGDNAPIAVHVTSALAEERGFSKLMSSATTGDVEATARDVETALRKHKWIQLVDRNPDVIVNVDKRERIETSRSTNKKGELTINHRYTASATVRVGDRERDRVDGDTTYSQGPSSTRDDRQQFENVANELANNIASRVMQSLDTLRPNRPRAGFAHKAKYKMLIRGDGLEVLSVDPGSPAEEAGLQPGDRIRMIDGEKGTDQMNAKVIAWWTDLPGSRYNLEVERNKQRRTVQLSLASPGQASHRANPNAARASAPQPAVGTVAAAPRTSSAPAPTKAPAASSGDSTELKPGMTQAQVTRAIGEPVKKVAFGAKTIWTYDGFTVTFVDGKVTDVK
jgi:PDZ domain-containing protein